MNVDRAISYVRAEGDAVQVARLAAALWDEPPSDEALQQLAALQQDDGSFAYWVPQVGNVCDTAYVLQWFDDLKVYRGRLVDPACRTLLDLQQEDCGWDEVGAVRAWDPPQWMMPGRIETRVWLTAFCAHVLIRFGYAEAEGTGCPADFLLAHCDTNGRLTGYLRATWIALPMFALYPGPDSEPFRKAVAVVDANYSPDWQGAYLAWLLRCLHDAGLPADHALVARCLDDLERKQQLEGSWEPEEGEGEEHAVTATVAALRELTRYGRI
ncbi:MAG: hypothetical protein AMJ93_10205 [Anaerolineae bacterium SM23_84]|nr:MAG: hypothetical protein AMJ93_10205 [Anaerolineae bacterium SM23_84]